METPPNIIFFIEPALGHLGEEIVAGLDFRERTEKATAIINHWYNKGEITDGVRNMLLKCWQELLLEVITHEREFRIRQQERNTNTEDLREEIHLSYIDFRECVGGCLDSLAIA